MIKDVFDDNFDFKKMTDTHCTPCIELFYIILRHIFRGGGVIWCIFMQYLKRVARLATIACLPGGLKSSVLPITFTNKENKKDNCYMTSIYTNSRYCKICHSVSKINICKQYL